MRCVVTGAAGFIGSHLVDRLLAAGSEVHGVDNFSTGREEFLKGALMHPRFSLLKRDLTEPGVLDSILSSGVDWVFHFSANADVRFGLDHPRKDLEQNTLVTFNVLDSMRRMGGRRIAFSSTGSVYGVAPVSPTPEDCPFPRQTSLYGASKLACEGLISAFAEGYGMQARVFRFVSILGERYSHGHVVDFVGQLMRDPTRLRILGDGSARKSYLYVQDCLDAVERIIDVPFQSGAEIFNLGTDETVSVEESVSVLCQELGIQPILEYQGGKQGWIGDSPLIHLDCTKTRALGWQPKHTITESLRMTIRDVRARFAR